MLWRCKKMSTKQLRLLEVYLAEELEELESIKEGLASRLERCEGGRTDEAWTRLGELAKKFQASSNMWHDVYDSLLKTHRALLQTLLHHQPSLCPELQRAVERAELASIMAEPNTNDPPS